MPSIGRVAKMNPVATVVVFATGPIDESSSTIKVFQRDNKGIAKGGAEGIIQGPKRITNGMKGVTTGAT